MTAAVGAVGIRQARGPGTGSSGVGIALLARLSHGIFA